MEEETSLHEQAEKKRPRDPIESFVHNMVESSKQPFEPGKPNECKEDVNEIEALTKRIRDKIQRT